MNSEWASWLTRWSDAGLIDAPTAERIRRFEHERTGQRRLRWPILVALAFGALMLGGGILLFVAAHWDALSPAQRFSMVLLMVGGFHAGGAATADRFPAMSTALHAIGSVALGAGIALSGQIFHLDEHWPGGIMLWALGTGLAWWLLRDTPQMVLFAVLAPAWLTAEWIVAAGDRLDHLALRVLAGGTFLLALSYFTAAESGRMSRARTALAWIGGFALPPLGFVLAYAAAESWRPEHMSPVLLGVGITVAVGLPLAISYAFRRSGVWQNAVSVGWVLVLFLLGALTGNIALYAWWAVGAVGLVAWGAQDGRVERINMGAVAFAATVLAFYFSEVMDKLGRSASLIGLGVLFLAGGWALERVRRRLVDQTRGAA
jgi:uncharacterized membrane protein